MIPHDEASVLMMNTAKSIAGSWADVFKACEGCLFHCAKQEIMTHSMHYETVRLCQHPCAQEPAPGARAYVVSQIIDDKLCSKQLNWYVPKEITP